MLLVLDHLFDQDKLQNIQHMLTRAEFVDGKFSAGLVAARVKHNQELKPTAVQAQYLDSMIMTTLAQNEEFRNAALPHQVSQPIFARYTQGMQYGEHIDDPLMGTAGARFRCDVAVTVFLNQPEDYDGGELVIKTTYGEQKVKCSAGSVVIYPASSLHRVNTINKGERQVAVCWIQSLVRDPAKRELLFELNQARQKLLQETPDKEESSKIDNVYTNLVRMWSEL